MADDEVELIGRERGYDGYFTVDRYVVRHRKFHGGWTPPLRREVFHRGHAAAVLPYDPARDAVVLIEQFRMGPYVAGDPPWMVEIVAGIIEKGERAEDVARREASEEAGIEVGALAPMGDFYASPGAMTERVTMFCGCTDAAAVDGVHGLDHEGEDIRPFVLPAAEIATHLRDGQVRNLITATALQWLLLHREALRADWG